MAGRHILIGMGKYTKKELDQIIDKATERAAERAVGFYYEKTKHHIDLVLESTGFIKERLQNMVTRDQFNDLTSDVKTIRLAVTDTNRDLQRFNKPGWFPGKKS